MAPFHSVLRPAPHADARATREEPHPDPRAVWSSRDPAGDAGDRFYAIVEGAMEVLEGGRGVKTLGPGGSFGEIALIRDVPRTATVVATAESKLLALDRDEFLRAITGHEAASEAAHGLATERLDELEASREP